MLLTERNGLPRISDIGAPYLRLAGTRVNPRTNGSWRETFARGLVLRPFGGDAETPVRTPAGARISHVAWSNDSRHIAFTITGSDGIKLWVADAASGIAHKLTDLAMNGIEGNPCSWINPTHLGCQTIPAARGPNSFFPVCDPARPRDERGEGHATIVAKAQEASKSRTSP